jgi:hypothetical protein
MHWEFIIAIIIAIPIILVPAGLIWYFNIGGIYSAVRGTRKRQAIQEQEKKITSGERQADQ